MEKHLFKSTTHEINFTTPIAPWSSVAMSSTTQEALHSNSQFNWALSWIKPSPQHSKAVPKIRHNTTSQFWLRPPTADSVAYSSNLTTTIIMKHHLQSSSSTTCRCSETTRFRQLLWRRSALLPRLSGCAPRWEWCKRNIRGRSERGIMRTSSYKRTRRWWGQRSTYQRGSGRWPRESFRLKCTRGLSKENNTRLPHWLPRYIGDTGLRKLIRIWKRQDWNQCYKSKKPGVSIVGPGCSPNLGTSYKLKQRPWSNATWEVT